MSQTHPEMLERLSEVTGLGRIYGPYTKGQRGKPVYQWTAYCHTNTQALLAMVWPWLGSIKKEQAINALQKARGNV